MNVEEIGLITIISNGKRIEFFTQKSHMTWYLGESSIDDSVDGVAHELKALLKGEKVTGG